MSFIPDLSTLVAFATATLMLTLTPGPDMTLFMSKTIAQGRLPGLIAVLGASTGLVVHTILAAIGISALLATSTTAFTILKFVGSGYLIWLAIQARRQGTKFDINVEQQQARDPLWKVWLQALGVNILNPKIVLFFVTFLPQFVSAGDPAATGKLLFLGFFFVLIGAPLCILMVLGAGAFARFLRSSRWFTRLFDWTFAGLMGAFALKLLLVKSG